MGCTHSRSEDLRQRSSLLHSQAFMDSLEDVPGYFNRTLKATDYLENALPSAHCNKQEMSFHGPPSHLQNSIDVHPFWNEYGREYHPKERFIDRSMENIPAGLLPGTNTAQEMRNIEIRETMQNLRQQVRNVWSKIDEVDENELTSHSPSSPSPISPTPSSDIDNTAVSPGPVSPGAVSMTNEEKSTIEFFESMIKQTLDNDSADASGIESNDDNNKTPKSSDISVVDSSVQSTYSSEEELSRNWRAPSLTSLLPNNLDQQVSTGRVHGVLMEDRLTSRRSTPPSRNVVSHHQPPRSASIPNGHTGFLKNSVYLPRESSISSLQRNSQVSPSRKAPPPPTKPKPKRSANHENKRYSYPMAASQPTEFGANFHLGHGGHTVSENPLYDGQGTYVDEETGIVQSVYDTGLPRHHEQNNIIVRNKLHSLKQQMNQNKLAQSNSFHNQQRPQRTQSGYNPGYQHSVYHGYNGNKNNSNVVDEQGVAQGKIRLLDGKLADDSESIDEGVLQDIEEDLISLQLGKD